MRLEAASVALFLLTACELPRQGPPPYDGPPPGISFAAPSPGSPASQPPRALTPPPVASASASTPPNADATSKARTDSASDEGASDAKEPPGADPDQYVRSDLPLKVAGFNLGGRCVEPASHAARGRNAAVSLGLDPSVYNDEHVEVDVDGDGINDRFLFGGAARWESEYLIYVMRGDCGYYVGSVTSSEQPEGRAGRHHGLYDLHTASDSCPLAEARKQVPPGRFCETIWSFDGKGYVPTSEHATTRKPAGIRP